MYNSSHKVIQSVIRFKAKEIKKALFENDEDIIVKKATRIKQSIYLNMTDIIEENTFYKVKKQGNDIILTKINVEELL